MVIPVLDRNPVRRAPVVTLVLVAINVAAFVLSPVALAWLGGTSPAEACDQASFIARWGAVPHELLTGQATGLVPGGAVSGGCLAVSPGYDKIPLLSAFTAMFVHAGWTHLLGNMLYLWVFGNNVEDRMGRVRFLAFYLVAGLAATYGFAVLSASSRAPLVGASGAIAAVLGAYLVMYPRARVWSLVPFLFFLPLPLPAWLVLGLWFVLQGFYATGAGLVGVGGVAYWAHVIGFVVGVVVGRTAYGRQHDLDPPVRRGQAPRAVGW